MTKPCSKPPPRKEKGGSNDDDTDRSGSASSKGTDDEDDDRKVAAVTSTSNTGTGEDGDEDDGSAATGSGEKRAAEKRMRTAAVSQDKVSHQQRWGEMYQRLLVFRKSTGHCLVPNRYTEDSQLGFWVSAQRRQYKLIVSGEGNSALTPERIRKLEEIGFQWSSTNPHHTPWETRYNELKNFVKQYGHAEVPIRWKENPKLSHWVSKQRHDFKLRKQGKSCRLSDEKVRLLNEVGFFWEGSRRSLKEKISVATASTATADVGEVALVASASAAGQQQLGQAAAGDAAAQSWGSPAPASSLLSSATGNPAQSNTAVANAFQSIASNMLAQVLGAALAPQLNQLSQPMVAALVLPFQTTQDAINSGTFNTPSPAFTAPTPAPVASPQSTTDGNANFVAQVMALMSPLQQQQAQQMLQQQGQPAHQPMLSLQQQQQQHLMGAAMNHQLLLNALQQPMQLQQHQPTHTTGVTSSNHPLLNALQQHVVQQPQQQALNVMNSSLNSQPFLTALQQALSGGQAAPAASVPAASGVAQQPSTNPFLALQNMANPATGATTLLPAMFLNVPAPSPNPDSNNGPSSNLNAPGNSPL